MVAAEKGLTFFCWHFLRLVFLNIFDGIRKIFISQRAAAGAKNAPERQYFSFSTKFDTFRKSAVLCWRQANMRRQTLLKPKGGKGSERTLA